MDIPTLNLEALQNIRYFDFDATSASSQSFRSTSSTSSNRLSVAQLFEGKAEKTFNTPLLGSRDVALDQQAESQMGRLLRSYILFRCSLNEHCSQIDFDETALDALSRMPFIQALQTVEHFSASVSPRILKRSAYLMGILRGQESQWDRYVVSGGVGSQMGPVKGRDLLKIPPQLLFFIGQCCLQGNCLPSDFTPEVCLSLQALPMSLALKAVAAYNSNKRIVAGAKGGIINRARFFVRLIQNVSEQNFAQDCPSSPISVSGVNSAFAPAMANQVDELCARVSDFNLAPPSPSSGSQKSVSPSFSPTKGDLDLEQLAEIEFGAEQEPVLEEKVSLVTRSLEQSLIREQKLMFELAQTRKQLAALQNECLRMRAMLGGM